jgi:hypothetical protein
MGIARLAVPVLLAALACDHPTPPEPGDYRPHGPFNAAVPRQLTFNPGEDLAPAWLPDGSGIIYQFQRLDEADFDRCLGILPAAGGTRTEICNTSVFSDDSTDVYGAPAVSPAGRLFYTRASDFWRLHNAAPAYQSIVVAPLATPLLVDSVRNLPYAVTPGGTMHYGIADVQWLDDSAVIYVAELVIYGSCARCRDTLHTGLELARMDLRGAPGTVTSIPGTDSASSVALGAGDTIYYTVAGDSRVLRRALATGDTATVWDFGSAGVARDVAVRGRRLYAVVGGVVIYQHDPSFGPIQRDSGGTVYAVDRDSGTSNAITLADRWYRHIMLSPDGRHIVAEGYDVGLVAPQADLWLIDIP